VVSCDAVIADQQAEGVALEHFQRNLVALKELQGDVVDLPDQPPEGLTWLLGRDGALTAQDPAGAWVTGCSLPLRAAESMLESMQATGGNVCFLAPDHAAQLRAAFARLDATQAILAIIPDLQAARFVLCGDDFVPEIRASRLWMVAGEDWARQLEKLLSIHEGLALPVSFIRLPVLEENRAQALIEAARAVFSAETSRRSRRLEEVRGRAQASQSAATDLMRVAVVAPSRFRLWDSAGWLLRRTIPAGRVGNAEITHFDPDDPRTASPVALAEFASQSDAIVTVDAYRSQMPGLVASDVPWLTWVTSPRIAPPAADAPADRLMLADESLHDAATAAGWSIDRIRLATWPPSPATSRSGEGIALLSDTCDFNTPPQKFELSSHQLLWQTIGEELRRNPLAVGEDINGYLNRWIERAGLDGSLVNRAMFIDRLIAPAFLQGVVKLLLSAGLPVHVYGSGWDQVEGIGNAWGGEVRTIERFEQVIASAGALLHPSPIRACHLCQAFGKPVLHGLHRTTENLVTAARQILSRHRAVELPSMTPLSVHRVLALCPPA